MTPFQPVKSEKVSERVVRQIKDTILSGGMKPGDRLPPERELVEWFQVSRISIREALKSLETSGLLTIKPGSGVFVAHLSSKPMSDSLSSILRIQKASIHQLTEARAIFEPSIAKLACERTNPEDLRRLEQNIEEASAILQSNRSARSTNIEFHSLVAEFTHNSVLTLTVKTLLDVLQEMSLEIVNDSPRNLRLSRSSVDWHRRILKAFHEKKSRKACDLMLNHILHVQDGLQETSPGPDGRRRG